MHNEGNNSHWPDILGKPLPIHVGSLQDNFIYFSDVVIFIRQI